MAAATPASARPSRRSSRAWISPARSATSRRSWAICSSGPAARSCWVRWWARRCRCRSSTAAAASRPGPRPRGVRGRRGAVPADGAECVPRGRGQSGEPADSGGPDAGAGRRGGVGGAGGEAVAHAVPGGAINYLDVIEADRSVLLQQRVSVQLSGEQARSAVGLIRALGGDGESCACAWGWAGGCEVGDFLRGGRWVCSLPLNCVLCFVGSLVAVAPWARAARAHDRGPEPSLRTSLSSSLPPAAAASDSLGRIEVARSRAAPPEELRVSRDVALLEPWLVTRFASPAETGRAGGQFLHTWCLASGV